MTDMAAEELQEAEDWEIIRYCGDNAQRWAYAFDAIHSGKSFDRDTMIGWFANAIETASGIREATARKAALEERDAAIAEMTATARRLGKLQATTQLARDKLHAHNRPKMPGRLRLEVRDLLDRALAESEKHGDT